MKFEQISFANMSSLKGCVVTNYKELVEIFGKPNYGPNADMDKTTCEWVLKFEDGTVATIYDYKTNRTPFYDYEWHVGGYDAKALEIIEDMIAVHRDPLVKLVRDYKPNERVTG